MFYLLQENGDHLLQENGDKIILDTPYLITGIVTLNGSPVSGAIVTLVAVDNSFPPPALPTGIQQITTTGSDGKYIFYTNQLTVNNYRYHLFVQYESGGVKYNAKSLPYMNAER